MTSQQFKFCTQVKVRSHEIDWQGIVHNANYLLYFEIARMEYLHVIGAHIDLNAVNNQSKVVLVRNEVDYLSPARFGDVLNSYSRVASINNSSFVFEGLLEESISNRIISTNVAVHVWLDVTTNTPIRVPDSHRKLVDQYEKGNAAIQWETIIV